MYYFLLFFIFVCNFIFHESVLFSQTISSVKLEETVLTHEERYIRTIPVPMVSKSPVIDGNLNEPYWKKLAAVDLISTRRKRTASDPTRIQFAADGDMLYIAAQCFEKNMNDIDADVFRDDDPEMLRDDYIGIMITEDPQSKPVFQFYINANGAVFDAVAGNDPESWASRVNMAVRKIVDRYIVEASLPLRAIGLEREMQPGNTLWIYVNRLMQSDGSQHNITGSRTGFNNPTWFSRLCWMRNLETVNPVRISGQIVDSKGQPVAYSSVSIAGENGLATDEQGEFSTMALNDGVLPIRISHPGYIATEGLIEVKAPVNRVRQIFLKAVNPYKYTKAIPPSRNGYRVYPVNPLFPFEPDSPLPRTYGKVSLQNIIVFAFRENALFSKFGNTSC